MSKGPSPAERLEFAKTVVRLGCVEVTLRCKALDTADPSLCKKADLSTGNSVQKSEVVNHSHLQAIPTVEQLTRMAVELRLIKAGEVLPVPMIPVLERQFMAALSVSSAWRE